MLSTFNPLQILYKSVRSKIHKYQENISEYGDAYLLSLEIPPIYGEDGQEVTFRYQLDGDNMFLFTNMQHTWEDPSYGKLTATAVFPLEGLKLIVLIENEEHKFIAFIATDEKGTPVLWDYDSYQKFLETDTAYQNPGNDSYESLLNDITDFETLVARTALGDCDVIPPLPDFLG